MTNQANYIPITYQCDGIVKDFSFNWKIFQNDDLIVELIEVATGEAEVLEKNQYSVDFGDMGGSIKTIETYSADYQIKISRNIPLYQNKSFTTSSGFQATEIEKALDKTSCQMQDLVYNEGQFEIKTNVLIQDFKDEVNTTIITIDNKVDEAKEIAQEAVDTLDNFLDDPNAKKVSEIETVVKNQILTSQEITDTILNAQEAREIATSANETSNEAKEISESANETSQEALSIAQTAGLTPKGEYNSSTVYRRNDFVYRTTSTETTYYISKQNGNVGHPVTDTNYWALFITQIAGQSVQWGNIVGNILGQLDLVQKFDEKQDKTDIALQTGDKTVVGAINELDATIKDIQLFKVPNVTITGEPTNESGQFSDFSENDYLQFPYVDITKGQPFVIDFCFTTGADITTQQNILDSYFGIALAIQNGKGIMALSSNGTGWDIGSVTGVYNIEANTTYFAKLSWDGTQYKTALSTDGELFVEDMIANSTLSPYKTTIFIGASTNLFGAGTSHPFKGTINLNKCFLSINGEIEWQGMDDAGLKTRLDVDASNLSEIGKQNITRLTALYQNELSAQNTIYLDETTSLYTADVTTATTFDFNVDNVDTTKTITFELKITMATVQSITFPANVKWLDDEAPDLSEAGVYYFVFRTDDAGANWFGNLQGRWGV